MTERLHFHFSLSCIGEGNGNPLQCSCLENPRDGGASWAAVYGVAQSQTRLKRLSSSSSSVYLLIPNSEFILPTLAPLITMSLFSMSVNLFLVCLFFFSFAVYFKYVAYVISWYLLICKGVGYKCLLINSKHPTSDSKCYTNLSLFILFKVDINSLYVQFDAVGFYVTA